MSDPQPPQSKAQHDEDTAFDRYYQERCGYGAAGEGAGAMAGLRECFRDGVIWARLLLRWESRLVNALERLATAEEERNAILHLQTAAQRNQHDAQKVHDAFVRRVLDGYGSGGSGGNAPLEQTPREDALESAIRYHLYVCPLPARNLRESIGYLADVQLAAPTDLPPQSLRDLDITSEANDPCICGHRKSDHNHPSKFPCHVCQCSKFDLMPL